LQQHTCQYILIINIFFTSALWTGENCEARQRPEKSIPLNLSL
jgi:hypothetical protein